MVKSNITIFFFLFFTIFISCQDFGNLKVITVLTKDLEEVSGIETTYNSKYYWMLNDGGNKPRIYALSKKGNIKKEIEIKSKNHDWEDLAADDKGNLYLGDFGNNDNKRKNLRILIIDHKYLKKKHSKTSKIEFTYEDQKDFPPKKDKLFFDAEAFFYFKDHLYILTKTRSNNKFGITNLYKLPATEGAYIAKKIGQFNNGKDMSNWITSADISPDKKTVALLTPNSVLLFSNFKGDQFFNGTVKKIKFSYFSQKESIAFKDNKTLLISDEKSHGKKGYLFELKI